MLYTSLKDEVLRKQAIRKKQADMNIAHDENSFKPSSVGQNPPEGETIPISKETYNLIKARLTQYIEEIERDCGITPDSNLDDDLKIGGMLAIEIPSGLQDLVNRL